MKISELTRRDILDELRLLNVAYHGRLDETAFLKRLYPLDELPSTDARLKDMTSDIIKHRVANHDWDDELWVFADARLELESNDRKYLNFLSEMIHPVVRSQEKEVAQLLEMFNRRLVQDGWKIVEKERISGHPLFVAIAIDAEVQVTDPERIGSAFARSQLQKCDEKIAKADYDGAITAARSLVESTLADIHNQTTGTPYTKGGSLKELYKLVKNILNLSDEKFSNDSIKAILRHLASLVEDLDNLCNSMGDRHLRPVAPQRHHAQLCVNSAKTLVTFLYDTLEHRFKGKEDVYEHLVRTINSDIRSLPTGKLLNHKDVRQVYDRTDPYVRNLIKRRLIEEFEIRSYRQSDVFFACLQVLRDSLEPGDLEAVFQAHKGNDQACGLVDFLDEIGAFKPTLLNTEMRDFCKAKSLI